MYYTDLGKYCNTSDTCSKGTPVPLRIRTDKVLCAVAAIVSKEAGDSKGLWLRSRKTSEGMDMMILNTYKIK